MSDIDKLNIDCNSKHLISITIVPKSCTYYAEIEQTNFIVICSSDYVALMLVNIN